MDDGAESLMEGRQFLLVVCLLLVGIGLTNLRPAARVEFAGETASPTTAASELQIRGFPGAPIAPTSKIPARRPSLGANTDRPLGPPATSPARGNPRPVSSGVGANSVGRFAPLPTPPSLPATPAVRAPSGVKPNAGLSASAVATASKSPTIRVALLDQPAAKFMLEIDGPYTLRKPGAAALLATGDRLAATPVQSTSNGLRIGTREFAATQLEIVPRESPSIWVNDHQYRGTLRVLQRTGNKVLAVNVLPLEEYVASVIDSEMPAEFTTEARAAQAIVARTFALFQMRAASPEAAFDLFSSTRSQKYLGTQYRDREGRRLAGESATSRTIARETQGLVCTHRGELFCTYYCAVCGGVTLQGRELFRDAADPVRAVRCDYCREASLYRWSVTIPKGEAEKGLRSASKAQGKTFGALQKLERIKSGDKGELPVWRAVDEKGPITLSGHDLRNAWATHQIPSPQFAVADTGRSLILTGRGHGHGAGLCQWGARGLAKAGADRFAILQHYYPGAQVKSLDTLSGSR